MASVVSAGSTAQASRSGVHYVQSIEGCLSGVIGEHGLTRAEMDRLLADLEPALARLRADHASGALALLHVPEREADILEAEAALARLGQGARTIVFFGTGGSSLGGQTLAQFAGWQIPGDGLPGQERRPRTRFYDNLDPRSLERALGRLDLATTRFVVISKSGNTAETLVQAIVALDAVKAAGLASEIPRLFLGLTEAAREGVANGLRTLFAAHDIAMLEHDPDIGGRFAGLTNVGLLPALARGLDVRALRAGARAVVEATLEARRPADAPAALGAAVAVGLSRARAVRAQMVIAYADRLAKLSDWHAQLWAESLGKEGMGTLPVGALGPRDQHSQLQYLMDGPREVLVTVLRPRIEGEGPRIDPELAAQAGIPYLAGRTVGDLVAAQARAIPEALASVGRPVRTIDIPRLDEGALGALMMHFMLETILAAHLLGIDPFDQPAVETGKHLARRHLEAG